MTSTNATRARPGNPGRNEESAPGATRRVAAGPLAGWRLLERLAQRAPGALAGRARPFLRSLWSRHRPFTIAVTLGFLLRVLVMVGYFPAMWFPDSFEYVRVGLYPEPYPIRPSGYSFLLWVLKPFHSLALVTALQHLMGIAMAVMLYLLLRRAKLPSWGATLLTLPVLFDAYQVQLEHLILSDTLFMFLVMSATTIVLWRRTFSTRQGVLLGVVLAFATLTRTVGIPVTALFLVVLLFRRVGWRALTAAGMACAIPLLAYSTWFYAYHGKFGITNGTGIFVYGRVMAFANCAEMQPMPPKLAALCTDKPPEERPFSQFYIWDRRSPLHRVPGPQFSPEKSELALEFAKRAIVSQPLDYAAVVAGDFTRAFWPGHFVFPDFATYRHYLFRDEPVPMPDWGTAAEDARTYAGGPAQTQVLHPVADWLGAYQKVVYLQGPILGALILFGFVGVVRRWRRLGDPVFLPWAAASGLILTPAVTAEFDYRYALVTVPLACLASGLVIAEWRQRRLSIRAEMSARDAASGHAASTEQSTDDTGEQRQPAGRPG